MYFDHSATTPVHPDVQNLINLTQKEVYGNPSSTYSPGKKARILLEKAREQIAKSINTIPSKIILIAAGLRQIITSFGQCWEAIKIM